jgi:hypothetical protein
LAAARECDTANCRRLASIIISIEPLVVMWSWCALERYYKENNTKAPQDYEGHK